MALLLDTRENAGEAGHPPFRERYAAKAGLD